MYTAFGEPVFQGSVGIPPASTRYGYAGAWGYTRAECREIPDGQGGYVAWCDHLAELGWLHVGHRYYDPSSGRFVQRDPIGIRGGWNVYEYTKANPAASTDPTGLYNDEGWERYYRNRDRLSREERIAQDKAALVSLGVACVGVALEVGFVAAAPYGGIIAVHGAHHFFPALGRKAPHIQVIIWKRGVDDSHRVGRLPLW